MSIGTYSPALTLVFAWVLIWILMGVQWKQLSDAQKYLTVLGILFLAVANQVLRLQLGSSVYSKWIAVTMHLPTFFVFRRLTRRSSVKVLFVILSVLVFTAPVVLVGRMADSYFAGNSFVMLVSNLIVMVLVVITTWLLFREGFLYLLQWGSDRVFLLYSLVPLLYYVYVFVGQNVNMSMFTDVNGIFLRAFPTIYAYVFYLLLLHNYREFREKHNIEMTRLALQQGLVSAEEQIRQMNENQMQTAIYRHDMRHHLTMINSFLKNQKPEQAESYIVEVQENIEATKAIKYCENEIVNLLCSSFASKAQKNGVHLKVQTQIPQKISISDMELCALISNGLENALHTAACQSENLKWVEFSAEVKMDKLLLQMKNPYHGEIIMEDGVPVSSEEGHGYGCHSIRAIAERYCGQYSFDTANGMFVMRVILPLEK